MMRGILLVLALTVALCGWLCGSAAAQPSPFGGAVRPATGDCAADAGVWTADLQRIEQRPLTVVVFAGSVPCFRTDARRPAVHGDPIYVGVLTQTPSLWDGAVLSLAPCDIEPSTPLIQSGGRVLEVAEAPRWVLLTALPKACWTDAVNLSIRGEAVQAGYLLQQYPRYRATVHVGTIFSEYHDDEVGRGPEYTALVVLYGVLRYVPSLTHGPYKGREIRNEHQLLDRLGLAIGVSVTHPQRRFVTGATFELLPGVSLFAGYERVSLSGQWRGARVAGLTLDAAYAVKIVR